MNLHPFVRRVAATAFAAALVLPFTPAQAQSEASQISTLSALPIVVSVTAPVMLLSAGAALTVVGVEALAGGAVWVVERASDGARASLRLTGRAVGALSVAAGTVVVVTAMSTGWILSAAGQAVAFIPNAIGSALLYNERVTR